MERYRTIFTNGAFGNGTGTNQTKTQSTSPAIRNIWNYRFCSDSEISGNIHAPMGEKPELKCETNCKYSSMGSTTEELKA